MTPVKSRDREKGSYKRAHNHANIHFLDDELRVEMRRELVESKTPSHLSLVFFINMLYEYLRILLNVLVLSMPLVEKNLSCYE